MSVATKTIAAALSVLAFVGAADAKNAKPSQLSGVMLIRGNCRHLVAADMQITNLCDGKLINTEFGKGAATEFLFMLTDGTAIIFHGQGGQAHADADTAIQTLTGVARVANGKRDNVPATGLCRFTNPFRGVATIDCEANSRMGKFIGSFVTDGSAPKVIR